MRSRSFSGRRTKLENEDEDAITHYTLEIGNLPGRTVSRVEQDAAGDEWIFTNKSVCIVGQKQYPIKLISQISVKTMRKCT